MKSRNVVLLALAIGCGLVAAFLTAKLGASGKSETVPVLVAAKNIDQGTRLEKPEDLFVRKQFTKDAVPPEFIDDVNQLRGQVLQRTLRPGSHVTIEDITPHNEIDLPVDEKTGARFMAMGIKVTQESGVGGLIKPGSRVDVVCVERMPSGRSASTIILQYVLVVSVNDQIRAAETAGVIKSLNNVTLAVKQQEGMVLALAGKRGELSLMLRDKEDKKVTARIRAIDQLIRERRDEHGNPISPEYPTLPVAVKPIPPGTTIDDPAIWFEERKVLEVPKNAVARMEDLKGKTVKKEIFENSFVAAEAFEGELPKNTTPEVLTAKTHTVGVQVGSSAPKYYHFKDGSLQEDDERGKKSESKLTPESRPQPKRETKPEASKTSKDDAQNAETK